MKPVPTSLRPAGAILPDRFGDTRSDVLERRVPLYVSVIFAVISGLYLLRVTGALFSSEGSASLTTLGALGHLGIMVATGLAWLRARVSPTHQELAFLELFATLSVPFGGLGNFAEQNPIARPELSLLIILSLVLAARAALVPSSPWRTALVGAVSLAPLVLVSPAFYSEGASLNGVPLRIGSVITVAAWGAAAVSVSVVISNVVYGLRKRVEKAMQLGQYVLGRKLGEGGMGAVYEAQHALLRRRTAIKLIRSSEVGPDTVMRFEREALLTSELTHPNTISIYDFGHTPDGTLYYAMELIEGSSLRALVERGGPMPAARVLRVLEQVAGSLAEAHAVALVHRDLKAENVMLCERAGSRDFAKVLDFGLVKNWKQPQVGVETNPEVIVGTPHYMAPEVLLGSEDLTPAADVYAMGILAYYCLTGTTPFDAPTLVAVATGHVTTPPVPPSIRAPAGVPRQLEDVILRCLEKKPEARYRDGGEMLAALVGCTDLPAWSRADEDAAWAAFEAAPAAPVRGDGPTVPAS